VCVRACVTLTVMIPWSPRCGKALKVNETFGTEMCITGRLMYRHLKIVCLHIIKTPSPSHVLVISVWLSVYSQHDPKPGGWLYEYHSYTHSITLRP